MRPSAPPCASCSAQAAAQGRVAGADTPDGYIVLGMGKYGAFELNYSSDIDLIVFYDLDAHPPARRRRGRSTSSCA